MDRNLIVGVVMIEFVLSKIFRGEALKDGDRCQDIPARLYHDVFWGER